MDRANGSTGMRRLSLTEAHARYEMFSLWTFREMCRRGEIPHIKHPGTRTLVFLSHWLDAWDDGAELERRVIRRRGASPGRIVRPVGDRL